MEIYMYQGQGHSLIFDEGLSEWNWISGEGYRTNGPLVVCISIATTVLQHFIKKNFYLYKSRSI